MEGGKLNDHIETVMTASEWRKENRRDMIENIELFLFILIPWVIMFTLWIMGY